MWVARYLPFLLVLWLPGCSITIDSAGDSPEPESLPSFSLDSPGLTGGSEVNQAIGSGNVKLESRPVSGFDQIRFSGSGELVVEQTGSESLTIEAEDNILPLLRSDVENGQLILGLRPGTGIITRKPIIFRVTVKQLNAVDASGSGSTDIRELDTDRFVLQGNGSVDVRVAGRAAQQDVTLSGSGDYNGESLVSERARITVSGSADVVVNASEALDVQISGSGDVHYLGSPRVTKRVSGSGEVDRR